MNGAGPLAALLQYMPPSVAVSTALESATQAEAPGAATAVTDQGMSPEICLAVPAAQREVHHGPMAPLQLPEARMRQTSGLSADMLPRTPRPAPPPAPPPVGEDYAAGESPRMLCAGVAEDDFWEIEDAEIVNRRLLGRGAFGEVFRADWRGTEVRWWGAFARVRVCGGR